MGREYYHDAITDRSWRALQQLRSEHRFILIGGWAAWVYTQGPKSRDIDIILDYSDLAGLRIRHDVRRNDRLRKYEIKCDGFDIDIYVPHYSTTLAVPPDRVQAVAQARLGFLVPPPELLLALKLGAWSQRKGSPKGQKDLADIAGLLTIANPARLGPALAAAGIPAEQATALLRTLDEAQAALPKGYAARRRIRSEKPRYP